ncbi:hypothetical protein [Psychrobacter sp. FDAARGOS_221]|uniref:hypothetical protein n=1 Tax=Psychrobacter sp. FDAARGOS_221 TaxID=1975705 RepID=UPI000BB59739|nr:hypothetical protein [Psychrobacter sp. FDAARGOS_221]PNK60190.1 hypothetical protein A6J60_004430 [Psychrobacter sp. FDAARGOS_221]
MTVPKTDSKPITQASTNASDSKTDMIKNLNTDIDGHVINNIANDENIIDPIISADIDLPNSDEDV